MGSSSVSISANAFNGTSTYASSLQQAINQAVTIASLPMQLLQNDVTTLQSQSGELTTLQGKFSAISTAIQNLGSANGGAGLSASVGDPDIASATVDSTAAITAGSYQITVTSPGSSTTTLSSATLPTVADPTATSISTAGSFTLSVNGINTTITPSANTLNALAQAINSSNAGVSATIINIGGPSAPDYRLSLQGTSLGATSIQLSDGATPNLLTTLHTGTSAQYQVNGQPSTPISSNTSTVTIAPGVTVNLLSAGTTTVTVAQDPSAAENALSSLVSAYNAAATELATNHGNNGGALTGQSVVLSLQRSLQSLIHFTGGAGNVTGLADLGITVGSDGQLSFDSAKFASVAASDPQDLATFLGTATTTGFLATATNTLNGVDDAASGTIQTSLAAFQKQITADNNKITDDQNSIITMQNTLTQQMSEADAAIAALESQASYFQQLFTATQDAIKNG
jgi:flagellar hook-associated protein 2